MKYNSLKSEREAIFPGTPVPRATWDFLRWKPDYLFPSEVPDLWIKLSRSETSSSAYLQRRGQSFKLFCVVLVDKATLLPLTSQGYVLANTPALGAIANIGGHRALYIGIGNF